MKKGEILCQRIFLLLYAVLLSVLFGLTAAPGISKRQYQDAAGLTGALSEGVSIPEALKQSSLRLANTDAGYLFLQKYGYHLEDTYKENAADLIIRSSVVFMSLVCIVLAIQHRNQTRLLTRINGLTQYLESINLGKDPVLTRHEDIFSHLEDEIYKTVTELRLSRNAACKDKQMLADNLADISHQLKTPLTSMSLMAQLLSEQGRQEQQPYLDRLNHQIVRLSHLTSSLLTLSRLDAGAIQMYPQKVGVYELLTQAVEPIEELARERGVELFIQSQPEEELWADNSWTVEALLNIIKNCVEHTPSGGEVRVSYEHNPLYLQIIIQDTGPGFDSRDIPHLFQRFYRGKGAAKDSIGIGLALAHSILEKQGGMLRADNLPEGGARFTVKLYYKVRTKTD